MNQKYFLTSYLNDFSDLVKPDEIIVDKLEKLANLLKDVHNMGNKILIFGNGGSAAIASHFSLDLTKNGNLRCVNFNEANLITCFANDYGYEHWVEKAVEFYGDKGDVFIGISSSGLSKNILNGCRAAREKNFSKLITLSGMSADNPLRKMGDINLWIDSKAYNHIENIHQIWLLAVVDMIIGKAEYLANPDES
ncbi:SIS domain-containing protein [Bacteroidota bacterium]